MVFHQQHKKWEWLPPSLRTLKTLQFTAASQDPPIPHSVLTLVLDGQCSLATLIFQMSCCNSVTYGMCLGCEVRGDRIVGGCQKSQRAFGGIDLLEA